MPSKNDKPATEGGGYSKEKTMPWTWLYYIGTVVLGMDERTFWRTQYRKLVALWEIHRQVNGLDKDESGAEEVYIDQLF